MDLEATMWESGPELVYGDQLDLIIINPQYLY